MKKSLLLTTLCMLCIFHHLLAQNVGINTSTPAPSSLLDLSSTSKGLLVPRMTSVQRLSIGLPAQGLLVYDLNQNQFFFFNGTAWNPVGPGSAWAVTGNSGTSPFTNFIGTVDSTDMIFRTNNTERLRIKAKGQIALGLGATSPLAQIDVFANTVNDTVIFRGRNNNAQGAITQIGSIERLKDFSNTIDLNNGSNTTGVSVNLNNSAAFDFQMANDRAAKPGTNTWTIASDARLKDDVQPFRDGLSTIQNIQPVYYHYNGKAGMPTDPYFVGVLAQDLQQAAPYMVGSFEYTPDPRNTDVRETYLDVNNGALTYVLVNAVKELKAQNDLLRTALTGSNDMGTVRLQQTSEQRVVFSSFFSSAIPAGAKPVISITPMNNVARLFIKDVDSTGFTIASDEQLTDQEVAWVARLAVSPVQLELPGSWTQAERDRLIEKVQVGHAGIRTAEEAAETLKRNTEFQQN